MGPVDQDIHRSHGEDYAWLLRAAKLAVSLGLVPAATVVRLANAACKES
jgi:hypothetical protein